MMRRLLVTAATAMAALVLVTAASAGLWFDLDRSAALPGQTVHGEAVSPCSACGPAPLYLVSTADAALRSLKQPARADRRFVPVGRFTWKRGGRFTFQAPQVRPGVYQLMAVYRNGPAWTAAPTRSMRARCWTRVRGRLVRPTR